MDENDRVQLKTTQDALLKQSEKVDLKISSRVEENIPENIFKF